MEWISVETLPELINKNPYGDFSDDVLLLTDKGAIQGRYAKWLDPDGKAHFSFISLDGHGCGYCGDDTDVVTHWMPLPEPPKSETNG